MPIYLNNRRAAHAWISQTTITAGDLHIATLDGEAMVFHDSIDLSPYAGTDAGSTPYRFVFVDSAGKQAVAYGGAVGGGEALGAELITNGDFAAWTGDNPDGWTVGVYGGETETKKITESLAGGQCRFLADASFVQINQAASIVGSLHKVIIDIADVTSGNIKLQSYYSAAYVYATFSLAGSTTAYYTGVNDEDFTLVSGAYPCDITVEDVSCKKLTDIPATGLHLMSAKNGTTRNMTLVESGFNPKTVTKIRIYA